MVKEAKDAKSVKKSKTKSEDSTEKKTKRQPPVFEKPEYGVDYIAGQLGVLGATVRVRLRNLKIAKGGRTYDFGSKSKADEVVKQIKQSMERDSDAPKKTKKKAAATESADKPAKKKVKKKSESADNLQAD